MIKKNKKQNLLHDKKYLVMVNNNKKNELNKFNTPT